MFILRGACAYEQAAKAEETMSQRSALTASGIDYCFSGFAHIYQVFTRKNSMLRDVIEGFHDTYVL